MTDLMCRIWRCRKCASRNAEWRKACKDCGTRKGDR